MHCHVMSAKCVEKPFNTKETTLSLNLCLVVNVQWMHFLEQPSLRLLYRDILSSPWCSLCNTTPSDLIRNVFCSVLIRGLLPLRVALAANKVTPEALSVTHVFLVVSFVYTAVQLCVPLYTDLLGAVVVI